MMRSDGMARSTGSRPGRRLGLAVLAAAAALCGLPAGAEAAAEGLPALVLPDDLSFRALSAAAAEVGDAPALISPWSLAAVVDLARAGLDGSASRPEISSGLSAWFAVWMNTGLSPTDRARSQLDTVWEASTTSLDLAADGQQAINHWSSEATGGRIGALIDAPLVNTDLVVTTALLFKDAWTVPFEPDRSEPGPFTTASGSVVEMTFMTGAGVYPSWTLDGATVVSLGFAGGGRAILILPAPDQPVPSPSALGWAARALTVDQARPVRIALPKLDLSANLDLGRIIADLGLADSLAEGIASLTQAALVPGPIVQSVALKVDEAGAEAAAATAATGTRSAPLVPPEILRFDRPFLLFITVPNHPTAIIAAAVRGADAP